MGTSTRKRVIVNCEKLCSRLPLFPTLYRWRYRPMVRREIELAEITPEDTVLNVGCGSMPATAVSLAHETGAEIVCIDHDPTAVANASRFVDRLGTDSVTVREADGRNIDTEPFSVVAVALHTIGKDELLENFERGATAGDRAVVRCPRPDLVDQYGEPGEQFEPDATVEQVGVNLDRSALFRPA